MPDFDFVKEDKEGPVPFSGYGIMYGDVSVWWDWEEEVRAWLDPMRKALPHTRIVPWAIDTSNATVMHEKVYPNASRFIADAVAIAEHYGFDGWHIDYEDERPSDTYPKRSEDLQRFLSAFSAALHSKGKELVIDVAGWSGLLSNFSSIASSGVDAGRGLPTKRYVACPSRRSATAPLTITHESWSAGLRSPGGDASSSPTG